MSPVIKRLLATYSELAAPENPQQGKLWLFSGRSQQLGSDFYAQVMKKHQLLNLEYSILCQQLRTTLIHYRSYDAKLLEEQLIAALMMADLLEHLYLYYLDVPREVKRFRTGRKTYRQLLTALNGMQFQDDVADSSTIELGWTISQKIREFTANNNWYRLITVRCKRLLDTIDKVATNSKGFHNFVTGMDKIANPILPYIAWLFLTPRLLTNLFLLAKHVIAGSWMGEEEKSLGWSHRLHMQLKRRWFELSNDSAQVILGLLNCFVLTGLLSPIGVYLGLCVFAYDVALASIRAHVELRRLSQLKHQYQSILDTEVDEGERQSVIALMLNLNQRIQFEQVRLSINVAMNAAVLVAMCFTLPFLAANPFVPLAGAILLVSVSLVSYILNHVVESYRPKDDIKLPTLATKVGFFAHRTSGASLAPGTNVPSLIGSDSVPRALDPS